MSPLVPRALRSLIVTLCTLLAGSLTAVHAAAVSDAVNRSARITIHLGKSHHGAVIYGSGWTRHCDPIVGGYQVVVATAGHVLDVTSAEDDAELPHDADVSVTIDYSDGQRFQVDRRALTLNRDFDYGEITFTAAAPRAILPEADTLPSVGSVLSAVASPPDIADFGVFTGHRVVQSPGAITNTPAGAWLATIPVAPGASGGPVMNEAGNVVAFIDGYVDWPWGSQMAVLVPLPHHPEMTPAANLESEGSSSLDAHTLLLTVAISLTATALLCLAVPFLKRRPRVTLEVLHMAAFVCEKAAAAVEQAHRDASGTDKKQLAKQIAQGLLTQLHLAVPAPVLDAAIEAAVLLINTLSHQVDDPLYDSNPKTAKPEAL